MDDYESLLTVMPSDTKSQYPFSIMNEIQVIKTREHIELEFVKAAQAYRRANTEKKYKGVNGGAEISGGCTIMFVNF
jgi:hypothetical protein